MQMKNAQMTGIVKAFVFLLLALKLASISCCNVDQQAVTYR